MEKINFVKKVDLLQKTVKDFIGKKLKTNSFLQKYEELYSYLFLENENYTLNHISEDEAGIFDEIHAEINLFEPNINYRKEHPSYIDEEQLRKNIRSILQKVKNHK
ncbi:hypothetical protein J4416_00945 [Candidatus Pacearchaeota archaeon]|nr:hypothetical protein [Candidatus Pacearchaeota archaeon]